MGPPVMLVSDMAQDFHLHLRSQESLAPRTVKLYMHHFNVFSAYCERGEIPKDISKITHRHINKYLLYRKEVGGVSQGTRFLDYIALLHFFRWMHEEEPEVVPINPMDKAQKIRRIANGSGVKVPSDETISILANLWSGTDFDERRNRAILCLLIDTGARATEILVDIDHIDFERQEIAIVGKGGKARIIPFGDMCAHALKRYARVRKDNPYAETSKKFFLGQRGPLGYRGLYYIKKVTCQKGSISEDEFDHLHQLRHYFINKWKEHGGQPDSLEEIVGWTKGSRMHQVYADTLRAQRALKEYRKHQSPLDQIKKPRNK